ncbi:LysR family transcriptional regulator [Sorangium sp. So ce726]|uniref:LysR family transcriptional regulator n=1 Tax=Sorangium sp. So ce726 TaxID=3133319 RepID=UPI003F5F9437
MDRLDAIKTLLRVVETRSFSVPARELGVGQPAVSKTIARLEEELGLRLVGRTTRHVSATPAGQRLVDEVGPLVRALDERIARLARGDRAPSGTVRIAVAPGFGRACVVPLLRALRAEHPGVSVELAVSDRLADLVADNIDLAVRAGALGDSGHVARRVGETPLLTVGSAAYLARHGEPCELPELEEHECVVFFTRGVRRAWRFGRPAATSHHPSRVTFLSSNADDIRAAVLADVGLAQVPGWLVAQDLATGAVRAVLRRHEPEPIPLFFVRPAQKRPPDRVRVVEKFLLRELAREPLLHVGR